MEAKLVIWFIMYQDETVYRNVQTGWLIKRGNLAASLQVRNPRMRCHLGMRQAGRTRGYSPPL